MAIVHISPDAYNLLVAAAKSRATTPEALVEEFAHSLEERRAHVDPLTAEEFFHELGFDENDIAEIEAESQRLYPLP